MSKFSILILKYKKSEHQDFSNTFRKHLTHTMQLLDMSPKKYLAQTDTFGLNTKVNRSPVAHLSRLKMDFSPTLKLDYDRIATERLWLDYSQSFNTYLTSYPGRKSFFEPAEVMKEELIKRDLL